MSNEIFFLLLIGGLIFYVFISGKLSDSRDQEFLFRLENEMRDNPELYENESLKLYDSFVLDGNRTIDAYRKTHAISLNCAKDIVYKRISLIGKRS